MAWPSVARGSEPFLTRVHSWLAVYCTAWGPLPVAWASDVPHRNSPPVISALKAVRTLLSSAWTFLAADIVDVRDDRACWAGDGPDEQAASAKPDTVIRPSAATRPT